MTARSHHPRMHQGDVPLHHNTHSTQTQSLAVLRSRVESNRANGPMSATESSLEPSMALQVARQVRSNFKASHIYGADEVVADQNSCIMGGYAIPGAYGGIGMAMGVR
jgi:hypothetical protein